MAQPARHSGSVEVRAEDVRSERVRHGGDNGVELSPWQRVGHENIMQPQGASTGVAYVLDADDGIWATSEKVPDFKPRARYG